MVLDLLDPSALRSSKPEQAISRFKRAVEAARTLDKDTAPWTLARCLFHLGEASRQLGDIASARSSLEEAAAIVDRASAAGEQGNRWGVGGGGAE